MNGLYRIIQRLAASEEGPTATEYAVLLAVISATVIGAMSQFGNHMNNLYTIMSTTLDVF